MFLVLVKGQQAPQKADKLITKLGAEEVNKPWAAGLSIGIYHAGQTYFYNFGTVDKATNETPTQNTVYEIGSLTKTFVSLLLAKAVLDGKINLDDDIIKYLPGSYPNLQYNGRPIKVINLANTTSGLPNMLPNMPDSLLKGVPEDSVMFVIERFYQAFSEKDFYPFLAQVKLDTMPGYSPQHSNFAAHLLGNIMQNVYNKPLGQAINDEILQPLNMHSTGFAQQGETIKQLAKAYNGKGNAAPYITQAYMQGSGGLRSSTDDMLKYAIYLLEHKDAASQLALKKNITIDAGTNKVIPVEPTDTVNARVYYSSLNWWHYRPSKTASKIFSDGNTMGFGCYVEMYPGAQLAIVLLRNNSGNDASSALRDMADKIFKAFASH